MRSGMRLKCLLMRDFSLLWLRCCGYGKYLWGRGIWGIEELDVDISLFAGS